MDTNVIYNEDCIGKNGMKRIPDNSIDMILADLPYGLTRCDWDIIIPLKPLWKQYKRVIKEDGAIVLTASQPFATELINSNMDLFRYDLIWYKPLGTGFLNANKMPMRNHEHILLFYKHLPTYNPQFDVGKRKKGKRKRDRTNSCYGDLNNESQEQLHYDNKEKRYPQSIIEISNGDRINENEHPTQKPVALFEYLIKTYTNESNIVLDNVIGSGTTAVACLSTNRKFIGFEKEEKYYNIALKRIGKFDKKYYEELPDEEKPKQTQLF